MTEKQQENVGLYSGVGAQPPPYSENTGPYQQPYPPQPAYPTTYAASPPPQNRTVYVTYQERDGDLKGSIPIMPLWMAWLCFIINCLIPGFGTIIASFSVFCCADMKHHKKDKFSTFCLNFWIGWLQLLTIGFFFLGWIWSIMWGWLFVSYSLAFYGKEPMPTTARIITQQPVYVVPQNQQITTVTHTYTN